MAPDLASPALLKMMRKQWGHAVEGGGAPFRFAPAASGGFFEPHGWREVEWHATWEDARRLRRQMRGAWLWRLLGRFASAERQRGWNRFSGSALLERNSHPGGYSAATTRLRPAAFAR